MNRANVRVVAVSYRPIIGRIAVLALLTASVWLMATGKSQNGISHSVRMKLADSLVPVVDFLATPMDALVSINNGVHEIITLREENERLKAENSRLLQSYSTAIQIQNENERLRALLKFAPVGKSGYTSARVAVDSGSPYSRSILITAGADNGVREDAAVINDKGMIGRVIDIGKKTTRVLLLTDINSRIPVVAEASREHGMAAGSNTDALTLMYLPENSKLKVGEKIVTSGDGALIPPGLPVGIVSKIEKGVVTVQPFADWYRLEYVSVINF